MIGKGKSAKIIQYKLALLYLFVYIFQGMEVLSVMYAWTMDTKSSLVV